MNNSNQCQAAIVYSEFKSEWTKRAKAEHAISKVFKNASGALRAAKEKSRAGVITFTFPDNSVLEI